MKIDFSCPIELLQVAHKKGTCSFLVRNLDSYMLVRLEVTVQATRKNGESFTQTETFSDIAVFREEPKVLQFSLQHADITELALEAAHLRFEDGRTWQAGKMNSFEYELHALQGSALHALQLLAGDDAIAYPSQQGDVWVCVCGKANRKDDENCSRCQREKEITMQNISPEKVEQFLQERKAQKAEENKQAMQKAEAIKQVQKENERRLHKKIRLQRFFALLAIVLCIAGYAGYIYGLPWYKSLRAEKLAEQGNYAASLAIVERLPSYLVTEERTQNLRYQMALQYIEQGDTEALLQAKQILQALLPYAESADKLQAIEYSLGEKYLANQEYDKAIAAFQSIADYSDAGFQIRLSKYKKAVALTERKEWSVAKEIFTSLGNYNDTIDQLMKVNYHLALQALENKDWQTVVELLEPISQYENSWDILMQAYYALANQHYENKEFGKAGMLYALVADSKDANTKYSDAKSKANALLYTEGITAFENGDYASASDYFSYIVDHLDAWTWFKKAQMQLAEQALANQDVLLAQEILSKFENEEDVAPLFQKIKYVAAEKLLAEGKTEEAKLAFEALGNHADSAYRAQQITYTMAENALSKENYDKAAALFTSLGEFGDSAMRAQESLYNKAQAYFNNAQYGEAAKIYLQLGNYSDAASRAKEAALLQAQSYIESGAFAEAEAMLVNFENAEEAEELLQAARYAMANRFVEQNDYQNAYLYFKKAGSYKDAEVQMENMQYKYAQQLENEGKTLQAAWLFYDLGEQRDAQQHANRMFDTVFESIAQTVRTAKVEKNHTLIFTTLKDIDMERMPERYADLKTTFEEATYALANQAYQEKDAFSAKMYYQYIPNYLDVEDKLKQGTYRMLGKWKTENGIIANFKEDGSAEIDGQSYGLYFADGYDLLLGADKNNLENAFGISKRSAYGFHLKERFGEYRELIFEKVQEEKPSTPSTSSGVSPTPIPIADVQVTPIPIALP